jgi:hypothetical protein
MPSISLYLYQQTRTAAFHFVRPGGVGTIPRLRLIAFANLSSLLVSTKAAREHLIHRCVVDTGSYITTIPEDVWQHFRPGVVTPLAFPPGTPADEKRLVVAGGGYEFTLGELTVRLEDSLRQRIDVKLVAMLTRDGGTLRIPLTIGLRGGVIDGRKLTAVPNSHAPFGQAWKLEDA